jgi:hypothetical protein
LSRTEVVPFESVFAPGVSALASVEGWTTFGFVDPIADQ